MIVSLLTFGAAALASFYVYRKFFCHRYFKKIGVPGPEPHWLFGNLRELWRVDRHKVMVDWAKKYGDTYGIYEGPSPILVTSNIEAAEQICVKQFSSFQGHNLLPIAPGPDETESVVFHIFWAQGEEWKRLRTSVNTAFTSGKLKSYAPLLERSAADFMELLEERCREGKSFDIRPDFQLLTMDLISAIGFGIDVNVIRTRGAHPILKDLREMFDLSFKPSIFMETCRIVPGVIPIAKALMNMQIKNMTGIFKPIGNLFNLIGQVIEGRRHDVSARRVDLLQLMLDASEESSENNKTQYKPLCEREIKAMAFVFFFAGYETTAASLAFATYALATNPDVQEKLRTAIYEKYPKDVKNFKPDYDVIMNQMPYLDWVIRETLRRYPIGITVVNRFVVDEANVCGIPLTPECQSALVDLYPIHFNADLWGPVDPEKFYPERFSPEQSAGRPDAAFLAFGYGPRQCIGMRLALYEIKETLVLMLHRFKIVEPDGGYPPGGIRISTREGGSVPIDGVHVKLIHN